jgi:rifampicin phosphotransferase
MSKNTTDTSDNRQNMGSANDRQAILSLTALDGADCDLAGGKAVNLAKMIRAGLPVPDGFCVTTLAYQRWLASCSHTLKALDELDRLELENPLDTRRAAADFCRHLETTPVPDEVAEAILAAWNPQAEQSSWAVRSSATAEDGREASFAGQHRTCLNVRGRAALLEAIRACWISLFTERAIIYRLKKQIPHRTTAMAVVLQPMVAAEASGILFTADPTTGNSDHLVIEANYGLGEAVVSGQVSPDRLVLRKKNLRVVDQTIGTKAAKLVADESGGIRAEALPDSQRDKSCLTNSDIRRLAKLASRVERLFGGPQDIEWAVASGQIQLLQARPITAMDQAKSWEQRQLWTNLNTGEVAPDVATPLSWSMMLCFMKPLFGTLGKVLGVDLTRAPLAGLVAGRIYFNATTAMAVMKPFPLPMSQIHNLSLALGGGPIDFYQKEEFTTFQDNLPDLGFRWHKYIWSWPWIAMQGITHSFARGDAWCARIKAGNDAHQTMDIPSLATSELLDTLDRLLKEGFRDWDLIFLVVQGSALLVFRYACQAWLRDPDLITSYRLFAALGGLPEAEAGLSLWRMAIMARNDRRIESVIMSDCEWSEIRPQLQDAAWGNQFLKAWDTFMLEHGHHCRGELELYNARWNEKPDYILGLVRSYVRSLDQANPLANQQRLARERLELTAQCRQRLKNPIKRWVFTWSLRRAQQLARNREAWKNQAVRLIANMRQIVVELGKRLAREGMLAKPEDFFFLEAAEVELIAKGKPVANLKALISARRSEYERNCTYNPPQVVLGRFDPSQQPVELADANISVLRGIAIFPGIVAGRARVILRCDDETQVLPGEILIAPFTDPAWTPYFLSAAGVVIEQGGILSHGSIVAREYGLPSVTNVSNATKVIHTGDQVEVNGTAGTVRVLMRAS